MKKVRLPSFIKPERYRIVLKPDLERFVFNGEETIYLSLKKSVNEITLHAKGLKITEVIFRVKSLKSKVKRIVYNTKAETATFVFNKKLPKGKGELSLKFTGILNDQMRGFYRSKYFHNGKEKHMATTQFEATDARRALPCFDEPSMKAVFDVSLIVPKDLTAVSNSIELDSKVVPEHGVGFKTVNFAPTPKMSTYLLAFIVGEMEFLESKTQRGVVVRVFTTPGKKAQAKFALGCAVKTLDFFEKYFDINYPLPVLDMLAIPDFTSGAMENWGAITYRESALLVDEKNTSAANKQWVALVIAHEIAHQWFGNLVTMHWWTDLWLNEGFASYIEYLAVDKLFPSWDIWTQFAVADLAPAFKLDSLQNTHPIEVTVNHPDEIGEIFDAVSYSKGASVIRMLANYLGEKDFRDGLRYYLKTHAYKNTKTTDLWQALEKVSKKPVTEIMKNWTLKPGYPLIQVIQKPNSLVLKQSRFFQSRISRINNREKTIWKIPMKVESALKTKNFLLTGQSHELSIDTSKTWVKLNTGETSFFRTDYPAQLLKSLASGIKNNQLTAIDRLGVIRDAFALAESGQLPTIQALQLAESYKHETEYTVWVEIISGLIQIRSLIYFEGYRKEFDAFALSILDPLVKKIGWTQKKGEKHTTGFLRTLALYTAGVFGNTAVISKSLQLFSSLKNKHKAIPVNLRSVVYNLTGENGKDSDFNFLIKKYKKESLHEEKNRIGRALGNFQDKKLLKQALEFAFSKNVRTQDLPGILVAVWSNPKGKELAWSFVQANIKEILSKFALGGHMLSRILAPAGNFNTTKMALEIKNFFKKHQTAGVKRTLEQIQEKILSNEAWLKEDGQNIRNWLKNS